MNYKLFYEPRFVPNKDTAYWTLPFGKILRLEYEIKRIFPNANEQQVQQILDLMARNK